MIRLLTIVLLVVLGGCASMNTPSSSLIDTLPVVTVGEVDGESADTPKDHIVFIPANKEFPVEFSVKGDVFIEEATSEVKVRFKQDVYLYKYWASLDGKEWVHSHKLMNVEPSGGFDKSGGRVGVTLNLN